jgi:hypothetical protein
MRSIKFILFLCLGLGIPGFFLLKIILRILSQLFN